jgi:hypothetical protein
MKRLMEKLISLGFRKCDIFGYEICFRHQGERRYKTVLGGMITIMLGIFLIYLFTYFSNDCIRKINPATRMQNNYFNPIILNASSFIYALQFTDSNNKIIADPTKYLSFHAIVTEWEENKSQHELKFSKCDKSRHFKNTGISQDIIKNKIPFFNETFCLDKPEEFILINSGNEIPRKSIQIFVMECMNKTLLNVDCKFKIINQDIIFLSNF